HIAAIQETVDALSGTPARAMASTARDRLGLPHCNETETLELAAAGLERLSNEADPRFKKDLRLQAKLARRAAQRLKRRWQWRLSPPRRLRFAEDRQMIGEALGSWLRTQDALEAVIPEEDRSRTVEAIEGVRAADYAKRLTAAAKSEREADQRVAEETLRRRERNRVSGTLLLMPERTPPRWQLLQQAGGRFLSETAILPEPNGPETPIRIAFIDTTEGLLRRVSYSDVDVLETLEGEEIARLINPVVPDIYAEPGHEWSSDAAPAWNLQPHGEGWRLIY
ncbi:MAG: hypothetical protein AAGI34_17180, partial [Pseudomonadota bacterium]